MKKRRLLGSTSRKYSYDSHYYFLFINSEQFIIYFIYILFPLSVGYIFGCLLIMCFPSDSKFPPTRTSSNLDIEISVAEQAVPFVIFSVVLGPFIHNNKQLQF